MIYYTQLIFIKAGQENSFHQFEDQVLPLLLKHHGQLLLRVRPESQAYIGDPSFKPYEIHLVSFDSKKSFEAYANDPDRTKHLSLKNQSIEKVILIEGVAV